MTAASNFEDELNLSPDNWDDHWENYAEQTNRFPGTVYRKRLLARLIRSHVSPGGSDWIIDFGSGPGILLEWFSRTFPSCKLAGVEMSETGIASARKRVPSASFYQANLLELQNPPPDFRARATIGVCSEVLEHVDDPVLLLMNLKPWLAAGAHLFITVPGSPMSAFQRHIGHRRHYTKSELGRVLAQSGYKVNSIFSAGVPFFNIYQMLVLLRGKKLVQDAAISSENNKISLSTAAASAIFRPLMSLNFTNSPGGWQIVAHALNIKRD
jgi:trans-aconitate methyltransferase